MEREREETAREGGLAALLAETWLVMNNPICLSLLELLVLHANTAESITDPL